MAKKSMVARKNRQSILITRLAEKRRELKTQIRKSTSIEEAMELAVKLQKMPVNSSPSRMNMRCGQCGRPRGVYRKFRLCRMCLRKQLMNGNVPGGKKASW
jgi:small subunit ribosomal protein S14